MNEQRNRHLTGGVGVFLLLIAGGMAALVGTSIVDSPVLLAQVGLLGVAGLCDVIGATDTPLTGRFAWYRWSGLGNVLLGVSLPFGFAGTETPGGLALLAVVTLGGLSLAAMGLDMLAFHGKYTRGERLDRR